MAVAVTVSIAVAAAAAAIAVAVLGVTAVNTGLLRVLIPSSYYQRLP